MDQAVLVKSGQALVKALDSAGFVPRLAMWVHNPDTDTWKLWLVGPAEVTDKRESYRRVAEVISKNRSEVSGLDISSVEMVEQSHPAMQGIGRFLRMPGLGAAFFSGNRFNNFYLPDGVILRSNL